MSVIWTVLVFISLCLCMFGDPVGALNTALCSCADALGLSVNLCAVYAWWLGIFSILEQSGAVDFLASVLVRPIKALFGSVSQRAVKLVCLSISANMLGVSNAATPYGIEACAEMSRAQDDAIEQTSLAKVPQGLNDKKNSQNAKQRAPLSRSVAMLFVLNATSLQILPTTVVGMRAAAGSLSPSDIVLPTLIVSAITTVLGVLMVSFLYKKPKNEQNRQVCDKTNQRQATKQKLFGKGG